MYIFVHIFYRYGERTFSLADVFQDKLRLDLCYRRMYLIRQQSIKSN